jgi:hypothetical protein
VLEALDRIGRRGFDGLAADGQNGDHDRQNRGSRKQPEIKTKCPIPGSKMIENGQRAERNSVDLGSYSKPQIDNNQSMRAVPFDDRLPGMARPSIRFFLFFLCLAFPATVLSAQSTVKEAEALKISEPILVDGDLNEPAWANAPILGDFIQFAPERGRPASLETKVRILYDGAFIYIGFSCRDPEPERIASSQSKRDSDLQVDDAVAVCLDTFFDRRNCYYFMTNLQGAQFDGRIVDNGLNTDLTWDGVWKSAARRTDDGWSAELAIALSSLKYAPGEDVTWGLSLGRFLPRRLESSFWTGPLESITKVSQYGVLKDLDLAKAEDRARIVPHLTTRFQEGAAAGIDLGVDARYALSQAVSADLTVNPDFATVEADQEQINLTRFELSLPEKRNFFLEGSEIYKQRISLFYSRRIGDIYGGVKLFGKTGGFEFSGLSAQTRPSDATGGESANFTIFRLKRDILRSSSIGFLAANRLVNGRHQGTAGVDTSLYFSDTLQFTGQAAVSYGEGGRTDYAFFLRPSYDSANTHFHVRYTQLGDRFGDNANAVGYIRDDNRRELDSAFEQIFWIKSLGLERINYGSNYNIYWGLNGTLRSWQIDEELAFDFKNKLSFEAKHTEEYKLYEKGFRNRETEFTLGYNTREWQSAEAVFGFGRNYDLDFKLFEGKVNVKVTADLSLEYSITRLFFEPDPEGENTWIHLIRATQYFTKDLFLKVFYQLNSSIEKKYIQVLFVYRFLPPFGLIQVAFQKGSARFGERGNQGNTLFIKLATVF